MGRQEHRAARADFQVRRAWGISVFKVEEHRPCAGNETAFHFSGYVSAEPSNFVNMNEGRFVRQLFVDSASGDASTALESLVRMEIATLSEWATPPLGSGVIWLDGKLASAREFNVKKTEAKLQSGEDRCVQKTMRIPDEGEPTSDTNNECPGFDFDVVQDVITDRLARQSTASR